MKFSKPAYQTVHFSEKIWIKCPQCSKPALVETKLPKYTIPFPRDHKSVCKCNFCGFQDLNNEKWLGYVQGFLNRGCGNCGSKIVYTTEPTRTPFKSSQITCSICKTSREYEIKWYPCRHHKATDPYFGFDLWFQTSIREHILWVYNIEHLNYLKEYIDAKLREDNERHKYSMITNLPKWLKSNKNRELIVKKLSKMEEEFEKNNR